MPRPVWKPYFPDKISRVIIDGQSLEDWAERIGPEAVRKLGAAGLVATDVAVDEANITDEEKGEQ